MGARKRSACDDDDGDDDDVPARVGRPRTPEEFGPPKPEPYQVKTYRTRLQSILDALEIAELGRDERMFLQRMLWRPDRLHNLDPKRFPAVGDDRVILLLRSIAETANGVEALALPILRAVSGCLYEVWISRGLGWLEAMDAVPLLEIQRTLLGLGLEDHLEAAIRWKLTTILGPPIVRQPEPKKPARKVTRPPTVSQRTWDEVTAMQKADRRRREMSRRAVRMAA